MDNPTLTIHIEGPAGAGKSVLARHIASSLAILGGHDVEMIDEGRLVPLPDAHEALKFRRPARIVIITGEKA